MDANVLLEKLRRTGPTSPLPALAELSVDALLAQRVGESFSSASLVTYTRAILTAWLESDSASVVLNRVLEHVVHRLNADKRPLGESVAPELVAALRAVLGRPFSPDRAVVLSIIDRPPVRELVRAILLDELLEFARRASAPVAGVARGLGALARMAGETVKARSGRVGSLVGAVGDEVERQLEKRASDFVDAALGGVFGQVADVLCDPRRVPEATELRTSVFEGVLELTGPQLARELLNADVAGGVEVLRKGLKGWVQSPRAERELMDTMNFLLALENGTLKELLTVLGVLTPVRALLVEQTTERLTRLLHGEAFAQWLGEVLAAS